MQDSQVSITYIVVTCKSGLHQKLYSTAGEEGAVGEGNFLSESERQAPGFVR